MCRLIQRSSELLENDEVAIKVISSLMKSEQYQEAGELYESIRKPHKALECYRKGHVYVKAMELAKFVSPKGKFVSHIKKQIFIFLKFIKKKKKIL